MRDHEISIKNQKLCEDGRIVQTEQVRTEQLQGGMDLLENRHPRGGNALSVAGKDLKQTTKKTVGLKQGRIE